ncbi:Hypothetical protein D9617_1g087090 [Elsinoe fawcettii]|nr:Hypothetical protein D9617_1g087090 [Elsinoe fawcettii]
MAGGTQANQAGHDDTRSATSSRQAPMAPPPLPTFAPLFFDRQGGDHTSQNAAYEMQGSRSFVPVDRPATSQPAVTRSTVPPLTLEPPVLAADRTSSRPPPITAARQLATYQIPTVPPRTLEPTIHPPSRAASQTSSSSQTPNTKPQ